MIVGLLHPGEMGAAVGACVGGEVIWASAGRSAETRARAAAFRDAGSVAALAAEADLILSICPPHAAVEVARACAGFGGIYVDANAISPQRAREVAALQPRFVDGGIVGGPTTEPGTTLYLSGVEAPAVASLFDGSALATRLVSSASAVKMA
jgi:3-hydroxyisobutyrate dehydrogenase-like beta-hydroxyacid dehydrogenase